MRKSITIGNKDFEFEATLGTAELYQIFTGDNMFEVLTSYRGTKGDKTAAFKLLDVYKKIMYVMNVQATAADVRDMRAKMNMDDYINWLFQFDNDDITSKVTNEIAALWNKSNDKHSQAKNP